MKVVVCGGRGYNEPAVVWYELDRLHNHHHFTDLMQGGCPTGADKLAKEWASKDPNIKRWVCHAEWDKHGRAAGPKRNARMVEWRPDLVVAFPGGRGTANMVKLAKAAGIPVHEVN